MSFEKLMEEKRDRAIREGLMSDEFLLFLRKNKEPMETMYSYYRCAVMEVETKFRVLDEQFSAEYDRNPIESIKTRLKSHESLIRKIRERKIPLTLESIQQNITDIAGVRVICAFNEDIYMLAECLLRQDDVRLLQKKDYIKNPKESGYRSLHLIIEVPIFLAKETRYVTVEVQLRTIAMDFWASLEHKLRYKKDIPEGMSQELQQELFACAELSASLDERMQALKHKIVPPDEEKQQEQRHRLPLLAPHQHAWQEQIDRAAAQVKKKLQSVESEFVVEDLK